MDLSVTVYFTDSENEDTTASVPRRQLRDMHNVLEMPKQLFVANFRVTKDIFRMLHEEFEKYSAPSYRSTHVRGDVRLATFLRFLATGSYQQTVGNEIISSTSKATVSRVITECLDIFAVVG
ncbi:uncharacterized protein LOC142241268 [Haematobia irritans]|uniref:uncharacterized protein LOC142241268 n=1 Tax=Haematobia irritans TaxID=7368 RepID=UPI003F501B84